MKKTVSKIICAILGLSVVGSVAGCGGIDRADDDVKIDKNKSQITVAFGNGGVGSKWISKVIEEFEKHYENEPFEEGKTGVQVLMDPRSVVSMTGVNFLSRVDDPKVAVYFLEEVNYYDVINSDRVADVTDLVSSPLTEYGEEDTILDKLDDSLVASLKSLNDQKYYGLPFFDGFYQMYYDVDLFDEYGLYFKKGATTVGMDVLNAPLEDLDGLFVALEDGAIVDDLSVGADRIEGTYDDGLPVTYDDFFALCRYVKYRNEFTPTLFCGGTPGYKLSYANSLLANDAGFENYMRNLTLSGTATDLVEVSASGTVTPVAATEITNSNAWMLQKQESRYNVLNFLYHFVHESDFYDSLSFGSLTATGAQERFLRSRTLSSVKPVAMFVEGSWWHNEASNIFSSMASESGSKWSKQNRRIGMMPPLRSEDTGEKLVLANMQDSMIFINAHTKGAQLEIAKKFYRFLHTDKALAIFSEYTGMTRAFEYELPENASYYAKSLYNMKKNADVVYSVPTNPYVINNENIFGYAGWAFSARVSGKLVSNPMTAFKDYGSITAAQYFNALDDYQQDVLSKL